MSRNEQTSGFRYSKNTQYAKKSLDLAAELKTFWKFASYIRKKTYLCSQIHSSKQLIIFNNNNYEHEEIPETSHDGGNI